MPDSFASADTSSYNDPTANRLIAAASNDPQQSIQLAQGRQQIQQNQVKLDSDTIALGRQKLATMHQLAFAIGADPTQANAQARLMEVAKSGALDPDTVNTGFAQLLPLGDDPQKIRQWAFDHGSQIATYDQQLQNMGAGAPTLVNTGSQLQPMTPQSGLHPSMNPAGGGAVPLTTTPEFNKAPRTWKTADGVDHQGTQEQYEAAVGAGASSGGSGSVFADAAAGRSPPPAGAPPATAPPAAQPSAAPPPLGQAAPKTTAPQPPTASPQNAGLAGPVPGLATAQTVDADASAKQFADVTAQAANLPNLKATVSSMEAQLPRSPQAHRLRPGTRRSRERTSCPNW